MSRLSSSIVAAVSWSGPPATLQTVAGNVDAGGESLTSAPAAPAAPARDSCRRASDQSIHAGAFYDVVELVAIVVTRLTPATMTVVTLPAFGVFSML